MFKKIYKSFIIVLFITILSKIASFISELIIAYILGTSEKADAYSMIIGIHQVIYPMLSVGIWSVFLPKYKGILTKEGNEIAEKLANKVITMFIFISIVLVIIINIFAGNIIKVIATGFNVDLQTRCTSLLRIYSPYFIFVIISSIYAAILQSHDKFFGSQIREIVTYLPTIILGPILYKIYDLEGLIVALVLGSVLRLIILFPFLDFKSKFKLDFEFKDNNIKDILLKMPSVLVTTGIEQLNTLIDKMMASGLSTGSVSSLNYGNKLVNAFNGLFTSTISTILYPTMSKLVAEEKKEELKKIIENTIIIVAIIVIPISMLMILFKEEIVSIVFQRGEFNENSVEVTSMVFCGYLVGMYYIGIKQIINNVFYSIGNTKVIMYISLISIIINIILNIILAKFLMTMGLAIATSIASIVYFILALVYLNKLGYIGKRNIIKKIIKIYIISIITYLITYFIKINIKMMNEILLLLLISITFSIIYLLQLKLIKLDETKKITDLINTKIGGKIWK